MTDPQELERVRAIHEQLDRQATLRTGRDFRLHLTKSDVHLVYTAEEIRSWPGMKAKLLAEARFYPPSRNVSVYTILSDGLAHLGNDNDIRGHQGTVGAIARGLCMYPEMLDDSTAGAPASSDYDWREIDRNETNVLWEAMRGGAYAQQVSNLDGKPKTDVRIFRGGHYRAQLGRRGWICQRDSETAFWQECGDYVAREGDAARLCNTCSTAYKSNDYSSAEQCGYCRSREQLSHVVDDAAAKHPPALRDRTRRHKPSKHDARAIDLDQAWSTPGWES